jgi:hypothetical protein
MSKDDLTSAGIPWSDVPGDKLRPCQVRCRKGATLTHPNWARPHVGRHAFPGEQKNRSTANPSGIECEGVSMTQSHFRVPWASISAHRHDRVLRILI